MTPMSFSDAEYAGKRKQTRREVFLAEMEQVVPWSALLPALRLRVHSAPPCSCWSGVCLPLRGRPRRRAASAAGASEGRGTSCSASSQASIASGRHRSRQANHIWISWGSAIIAPAACSRSLRRGGLACAQVVRPRVRRISYLEVIYD